MKKPFVLFMATSMFAPYAVAAEITPYVGVGLIIDKVGTSAKRVKFDASKVPADIPHAFVANAGDNMDLDMAFAGEITAGVKIGSVRAELEAAIRSASEDDYELFNGTVFEMGPLSVPAEIETSTSVRHNSYMENVYYDFNFGNSNWTPYIGAGVGLGVYRQKATVDIDLPDQFEGPAAGMGIPVGEMEVANDTLYEFEWQVGIGID